jgi:fumarate reductase flavoprotein subunit
MEDLMDKTWDAIIVGAGSAGMVAAIFASRRGGKVLVVESTASLGGTLHWSSGRMSAAGTKLQAEKGITDSKQDFFDDVMRICGNTADPALVRLAVEHATETFDWLMEIGMPMVPQAPVKATGLHEPYRTARYAWGPELGRSVYKALEPSFYAEMVVGGITLLLETSATSLIQDEATGRVLGVHASTKGGAETAYLGSNVLLCTGGFAANPKMVQEIQGHPLYGTGAAPSSQGKGLELGLAAGGYLRGQNYLHAKFGMVLADYSYPSRVIAKAMTMPEIRAPWEIYLDSTGKRFVAEDEPSIDARERALIALDDKRFWIVFDQTILDKAPPVLENWSREQVTSALGKHPMFLKADTLSALAKQMEVAPAALETSVAEYNDGVSSPDRLGRTYRPAPIATGPFYAIRQHVTLIVSTAGLVTDDKLRIVDRKNKPIEGLYAAGEILGSVATMGDAAANGMLLTPALTFGRLLGERIMQWDGHRDAA